ncbi:MAG: succinate dehydrogenase assembly factor 2 [Paracoccaceae bacterium]|nr:succinate dehydrogenase assembly factor 2 [Paracoccaceae bacterium]
MSDTEARETRLKRLRIRSWRRGTREMDLLLGGFFDADGATLEAAELDLYEALLGENDHDIYAWLSGRAEAPEAYGTLLGRVSAARNPG